MSAILPISKGLSAVQLCDDCGNANANMSVTVGYHTSYLCTECCERIAREMLKAEIYQKRAKWIEAWKPELKP